MDDDLLKSMFLQARDQYQSAVRWAFIAVLVCLAFHLITFSQFVYLGKQLSGVEAERSHLGELEQAVQDLGAKLELLKNSFSQPLGNQLDSMLTDLRNNFTALDQAVALINTPDTADVSPGVVPVSAVMAAQQAQTATVEPLQLDEALAAEIRLAGNEEQLRDILRDYIETTIIAPRYDTLNQYWQQTALPAIQGSAQTVADSLQQDQQQFPEQQSVWTRIDGDVSKMVTSAQAIRFQPPSTDPNWWSSIPGKAGVLDGISDAVTHTLNLEGSAQALKDLRAQVQTAEAEQTNLQTTITQNMAELEASFKEQEAQLETLGKPFEIITLDLDFVVSVFPLLLGIVLAATMIWESSRLRELAQTVKIIAAQGQGKGIWQWFAAYSGFSPVRLRQESLMSWMAKIGPAPLYWLWIVVAALQLSGWQSIDPNRAAAFTLGGLLAVGAALWYRLQTRREVLQINRDLFKEFEVL